MANTFPRRTLFRLDDLSRVMVPAAVAGVPGSLGPFDFDFPLAGRVTGILVTTADGAPETAAGLGLEVTDEDDEHIISDGRGESGGAVLPFAAPCHAMAGRAGYPFPMDRDVNGKARWGFRLRNYTEAAILVSAVLLYFDEVIP